jgi:hypothetical protein
MLFYQPSGQNFYFFESQFSIITRTLFLAILVSDLVTLWLWRNEIRKEQTTKRAKGAIGNTDETGGPPPAAVSLTLTESSPPTSPSQFYPLPPSPLNGSSALPPTSGFSRPNPHVRHVRATALAVPGALPLPNDWRLADLTRRPRPATAVSRASVHGDARLAEAGRLCFCAARPRRPLRRARYARRVDTALSPAPPRDAADLIWFGLSVSLFCSGGWRWYQGTVTAGVRGAPLPRPASAPGEEAAMDGCEIRCHSRWRRLRCQWARGYGAGAIRFVASSLPL